MRRKNIPKIFTSIAIFSLVFFQAYPLAVALAEDTSSSPPSSSPSSPSSSSDSNNSSSDTADKTNKADTADKTDTTKKTDKADAATDTTQKADTANTDPQKTTTDTASKPDPVDNTDSPKGSNASSGNYSQSTNDSSGTSDPKEGQTTETTQGDPTGQTDPAAAASAGDAASATVTSDLTKGDSAPDNNNTNGSGDATPAGGTDASQAGSQKDPSQTTEQDVQNAKNVQDATTPTPAGTDASQDASQGVSAPDATTPASETTPTSSTDPVVNNTNDTQDTNTVSTASDTGQNVATADASKSTADPIANDAQSSGNLDASIDASTDASKTDGKSADASQDVSTAATTPITTPTPAGTDASQGADAPDATPATPSTINTGDATAATVIENNVNTNVTTANGTVTNTDIYDYTGDINLLQAFQTVLDNAKKKTDSNSAAIDLAIHNINSALVTNNANTSANTGGNSASGDAASVTTGEASALTNIVNYINTNIVGDNWLYATLNIFGTWNGNLIVPGEGLLSAPATGAPSQVSVVNSNSALVTNDVTTSADTGGNEASSDAGNVSIQTGTAAAGTNVASVLNTNITQSNWFLLLFNNMGNWTGQLINWGGDGKSNTLTYNLGTYGTYDAPTAGGGKLTVTNENNAQVSNNVVTAASTGDNSASGGNDGAIVKTGNASALTNIFNMINTNIVGDNWFFGVVNNMGDWNGNVEFSYPDLAVALVDESGYAQPGADVNYTIHYKNLGQADASSTKLKLDLPGDVSASKTEWNLGDLKPGQEGSVEVGANVSGSAKSGEVLAATAKISTGTKEVNLDNNSSTDDLNVYDQRSSSSNDNLDSKITVKRTSTASGDVKPGTHVKNTITVENKSDNTLYNVQLDEKMLTGDNAKLGDFSWPIGKMKKGGKVRIEYDFIINNPGQKVTVNYVARAAGEDLNGQDVKSKKASSLLTVLGFVQKADAQMIGQAPEVAGAQDTSNAQAQVLGNNASPIERLPFWIWLASLLAFYLVVNWSLFPKGIIHRSSKHNG